MNGISLTESPATVTNAIARARFGRPLLWLNLVCLDAPIVAVSWEWLFARSFGIPFATGATVALFLTAWLIYLVDRLGDSIELTSDLPMSLRQQFCLRNRTGWIVVTLLVAVADLVVIARLDFPTVVAGAALGVVALGYLFVNHWSNRIWQVIPAKEFLIGFLFASGALAPLWPRFWLAIDAPFLRSWFLFACLCSLNCLCIARWECELDRAQKRVSIATAFPFLGRWLLPIAGAVGLTSLLLALTHTGARSIHLCAALSAFLLAALHFFRARIDPDVRTAGADLVLLTPLIFAAVLFGLPS